MGRRKAVAIDVELWKELKRLSADQETTISELAEGFIREGLRKRKKSKGKVEGVVEQ